MVIVGECVGNFDNQLGFFISIGLDDAVLNILHEIVIIGEERLKILIHILKNEKRRKNLPLFSMKKWREDNEGVFL